MTPTALPLCFLNGAWFLGQSLENHTGCQQSGCHIAFAPISRPPPGPSKMLTKVKPMAGRLRGKVVELNFGGSVAAWPSPLAHRSVWSVPWEGKQRLSSCSEAVQASVRLSDLLGKAPIRIAFVISSPGLRLSLFLTRTRF